MLHVLYPNIQKNYKVAYHQARFLYEPVYVLCGELMYCKYFGSKFEAEGTST